MSSGWGMISSFLFQGMADKRPLHTILTHLKAGVPMPQPDAPGVSVLIYIDKKRERCFPNFKKTFSRFPPIKQLTNKMDMARKYRRSIEFQSN